MGTRTMRDDRNSAPANDSTERLLRHSSAVMDYTCALLRFGAIAMQLGMSIGSRELGLLGGCRTNRSRD